MATIDFGTGPDTNTGDTVAQALAKLQARLDAGKSGAAPTPSPTGWDNSATWNDNATWSDNA